MAQCTQQSQGITWTGLNRLGDDGYGNGPWELVSGTPFAGADAYGEAVTLTDGYSDGNCAYMKADLMVANAGFMCDAEFAFCCDPGNVHFPVLSYQSVVDHIKHCHSYTQINSK